MDRYAAQQRNEARRSAAAREYPARLSELLEDWNTNTGADCAWLMYSANYLLRTGGKRWAIDPLWMGSRAPGIPPVDLRESFSGISYIVLTHAHRDHLDLDLLASLRELPILWIVPRPVLEIVQSRLHLPDEKIWVTCALQPIELDGLRLTPFDGLHWERGAGPNGTDRGIPATGYLAEFSGKRWLFPGDTRRYEASLLPEFEQVDGVFAHLWLGRAKALTPSLGMVELFCRFFTGLKARRIVVTHLDEFGRGVENCWGLGHYRLVEERFREMAPDVPISNACTGDKVNL